MIRIIDKHVIMHSFSIIQENQISQRHHQQLLINLSMRQAFHVLQLPLLELSEWMKTEIENNPVLEIDLSKEPFKESLDAPVKEHYTPRNRSQENLEQRRKEYQESLLTAPTSLYEHLMQQASFLFEGQEMHIAELIIGHLNEKGFLDTPLQEVAPKISLKTLERTLKGIQTLDPPGIAANSLRECLLLQLQIKNKAHSLAAKIVSEHFDALLDNRLPQIAQALRIPIPELAKIIEKEIAPLDLYPGYRFVSQHPALIIPDLIFTTIDEKWQIEVNTSLLPHFQIAPLYLETCRENEDYSYLNKQIASGKWLKKIVHRRNQTLRCIGELLLKQHLAFFNAEKSGLKAMTMQEAARELGLHESTIARAIAGKYLACPLGVFPLKTFFNQGIAADNGQKIANHSLREMLARMIDNEDKLQPLSDQQLAEHFKKRGIPCARRTIAKYRSTLKIASASKRRKWTSAP